MNSAVSLVLVELEKEAALILGQEIASMSTASSRKDA